MLKKWLSVTLTLVLALGVLFAFPIENSSALDIFPFVIMTTGNLRGQLRPFTNGANKNEGGLTKISTVVDNIRKDITAKEGYTMLVDAGNSLVGSDSSNYFMRKPVSGKPHPMIALMNYLKVDAAGYGISDFSMPSQIRDARKRESNFTWVSTNAYLNDKLYASDNRMLVYDVPNSAHVLKIAVISLPDPSKTNSIPADSIKGMTFADPSEEVIRVSDQLKELERADFIVLLTDMEWERNPEKVKSSYLYQLLERSRIDVCIPASDDPISGLQLIYPDTSEFPAHDVLVSSPGRYGLGLSRVELILEKCKCPVKPYEVMKLENGARNITGKVVKIGSAIEEDSKAVDILNQYTQSNKTFNEIIGTAKEPFNAIGGIYKPTSLSNFILQSIQETAKSNIAIFKPSEIIHNLNKGPLTYGDVYSILATDDMIFNVSLTGTQIKSLLEESSDYLSKGITNFSLNTLGLSYSIDLRQKTGNQIKDLKYAGKPIVAGNKYIVGIISSLTGGSGRPLSLANVKIQTNTRKTLRDVLIEKIRIKGTITPSTSGSWFIVPDYLDHWASESISFLQAKKVISGYSDGRFLPDKTITRAEYTKIAVGAYGISELKPKVSSYRDVTAKDWFYGFVEAAKAKGMLVFAEDSFFMPNKPITREEAMIELVVAVRNNPNPPEISTEEMNQFKASIKDFENISIIALPFMIYASKEGLIKGYADGTIKPKSPITRAETATIIYRAHYPTILLSATGTVSSKLNSEFKDPLEDRPIGGLASISSYMQNLKSKYNNFFAIDIGNYLMGSSVSYLSNGEIIGDVYSKIGYKAFGLSNEDLFYGVSYLKNISEKSKIDVINADIVAKDTKNPLFSVNKIIDFAGIKLGITGISGFSIDKPFLHNEVMNEIEIADSVKTANDNTKKLKLDGSNIQVLVTGLKGSVNSAQEISSNLKELLDNLNPKPSIVIVLDTMFGFTANYKDIKILAPGNYGNSIGISKIIVDSVSKNIEKIDLINQYTYSDELVPSKDIIDLFKQYEDKYASDLDKVIGCSNNGLKTTTGAESQLGDFVTDIMKQSFEGADMALFTPNLLKNHLPKGDIKVADVFNILPKDEDLVMIELSGSDLVKAFEQGATFANGLIQISGVKFKFDNTRFLYDRVVEKTLANGDPIEENKTYKVVITESMRRGLDNYDSLANGKVLIYSSTSLRNLLINFIISEKKDGRCVDREVEGRIELVYTG